MHQRITQITLTTEGSPIFAEGNYTVAIVDEGGGEFIEVVELQSADAPKIRIDKSDWSALRDAIDRMMDRVRVDDQAEEAEPAWRDPLTAKREERDRERMEAAEAKPQGTEQGTETIDLPDSVLRLVAIGIRSERYASTGSIFGASDLAAVREDLPGLIKYAREEVKKMITEARK